MMKYRMGLTSCTLDSHHLLHAPELINQASKIWYKFGAIGGD